MLGSKTIIAVCLGNPGKEYEMTRHNMGFLVADALLRKSQTKEHFEMRFEASVAKFDLGDIVYHVVKPLTYMNLSGRSLKKYLDFYKLPASSVLVVCDDVELPFGKMRLRGMGSPGGHNGLKSIEYHLGTREYCRLRIGVGRGEAENLSDHVLGAFSQEEKVLLDQVIEQAVFVIENVSKYTMGDLICLATEGKNFGRKV